MNPPSRPRPEEVVAKSKFDHQQLVARLYRTQGLPFQNAALTTLPTRPVHISKPSSNPSKRGPRAAWPSNAEKQAPEVKEEAPVDSILTVSHSKRLKLLNRQTESDAQKDLLSQVEVPQNLRSLLGSSLSLKQSAYKPNRALAAAGGEPGPTFSSTGQLPTSKQALQTLHQFGKSTRRPSAPHISQRQQAAAHTSNDVGLSNGYVAAAPTEHDEMSKQREYEKYLLSPFSFIDKVIESPYTEEFVYLNPRGPYDLVIVKHDHIDPNNYYTMSRAGVTHFYHTETDFTSLDQWEREYFLYTKMMEIPFFRKFRMWKAFYFWKVLIRRQKSNKYRKFLQENLYILNPYLRDSLIQLRNLCYNASKWTLFRVDPKNTLTLEQFREAQEVQKQVVMESLEKLNEDVRAIVLEACDVDLREFLITNGFRKSKNEERNMDEMNAGDEDYPQKISHAEKAAIRTKCRKLTKYIRVADYFIIDTLVTLCMDRTTDVLKFVERRSPMQLAAQAKAAKEAAEAQEAANAGGRGARASKDTKVVEQPLFSVELKLEDDVNMLMFHPELEEFQQTLEASIDSAVRKVMAPKRLINDAEFLQYTQQNVEDGDDDQSVEFKLESMVLQDQGFIEVKHGIKQGLAGAFEKAASYAQTFEPFKLVYAENNKTDIGSFRESPIDVLTDLLLKYEQQITDFEGMNTEADIGIIRVDSASLKSLLVPSPQRCHVELQELLPAVAAEKCSSLLTELQDANAKISSIPATVEEFVEIMSFLSSVHENQEANQARYIFVSELYQLMSEHDVKVAESDKSTFERLTQTRSAFKTAILLSEASINSNTERFSKVLEEKIPKLVSEVESVASQLNDEMIMDVNADMDSVIGFLEEQDAKLKQLEANIQRFQGYQQVLQVEVEQQESVRDSRVDMDIKLSLWTSMKEWGGYSEKWMNTPFDEIDVDEISGKVQIYNKVYSKAKRLLADNPVVPVLREKIVAFGDTLPVVQDLRNKHLLSHHWEEINGLLGYDIQADENFTMGTLISLNAMEHKQIISQISVSALQEAGLRDMLAKVEGVWAELNLPVNSHKGQKDVFILGNLDDIFAGLDDTLVTINTILGSRFVEPIRDTVNEWNYKLLLFQETLDEWMNCQRQWMYLETIFASPDIVRQLPEEAAMFSQVDKGWKEILRRVNDQPNAITAGTYPGLKDNLQNYNEILDRVQKQLESYLETKRQQFPRFYFLSNDELLKILAQAKNIEAVQPHLRKCFDNLVRLEFADKDIKAMFSSEGERVPLGMNLKARGSVEVWLSALEADMIKSLRRYMKRGVADYERMQRREWILEKFGQIVMTVSQIAWCRGCEQAITAEDPKAAHKKWVDLQLAQLSVLTELVRGNLAKTDRKKIVALITTDVHARDTSNLLKDRTVANINDFLWQQQLRFYWDVDVDDCVVRQANAHFLYGYEYMGVTSRLVITPLTDRCWMTITGALHLRFGAAPAGPAGTGKTESTKDLAKAMGILCVVFNCSDQINYKTMAKLFSGLAQAGAWTCLDEFNRIDIEVLSVIAQQLLQVRQALVANLSEFNFEDQMISLKGTFGVMITMNPGYAGRTELPDNLKVLFRPVSMMIPDYALIAEIMLFAEGFDSAGVLSKKMVKLYKLASEQLSQQDHYDFGMRAVKSVLVMAGSLKRAEPDLDENAVLIRAMRDSNIPKFLSDDIPLFQAIVQDLFPGVEIPEVDFGELEVAIKDSIQDAGLQKVPKFVNKVIQLYDTFNVRFGVMIVGPTGAGKSACYRTLAAAMTKLREQEAANQGFQVVHTHVLNPKCVTMGELYGDVDAMTQEWTDGLASTIMRESIADTSEDRHWVVFDGPVDALWIENMNTVLDDNMTLCLVNGERIKLKPQLRMLFEVQDLAVASPATVSRCGMVYMTPTDLGVLPYVRSWLPKLAEKITQETKDYLYSLFEEHLMIGLDWINENRSEPIATVDIQLTSSLCFLFQSMFTEANGLDFTKPIEEIKPICDMVFALSYVWGLGGSLKEGPHKAFSKYCNERFASFKPQGSFFDSYITAEKEWASWESKVPEFEYDPNMSYFRMVVPTTDTVKYSWLMDSLLEVERSVFFTGVSGVGKTAIIMNLFDTIKETKGIIPVTLTFSAQTAARQTQETIESKLVKLRRNQLGAPAGKKLVIFVDDVNMPAVEEYGAQPPIELLRQFQDYRGFYDRTKLFWKEIVDTTIVCASAPPGGGRNELTPRFVRHFNILALPNPSESVMKKIFGSIIGGFLTQFKAPIQKLQSAIVSSTIDVYTSICAELLPTPAKSHYTFNLRDISKVFQGILMIKPQFCTQPEVMARLWVHESMRCFHDRLINKEDKRWFTEKAVKMLSQNFNLSWTHEELFESGKPLLFGDFFRPGMEPNYEEQPANTDVAALFDDYLEEYNLSNSNTMRLVFFEDAIQHIARISRVLRQPRGNAMLVGVGGSGKQSLTRLACSMVEYKCYQIELTRGYGYPDFQEFLKQMMVEAGVEGKQVVFLFTENQIVQERFLEDTNNLLNSGEVPNLFPNDEMMKVLDDMTPKVIEMGLPATRDLVYATFVDRVRSNLHIVLCMSPVGSSFRVRCRQFPSLINCCTIDWYTKWPKNALHSVSKRFLADVDLPSAEIRSALAECCFQVHLAMDDACERFYGELRRRVYTTPKSYLDMIQLYISMLAAQRLEMNTKRSRLVVGLQKLKETTEVVDDLRSTLEELKPDLIQKQKSTAALLEQVAIDQEKADKVRAVVEVEEKVVKRQAAEVAEIQADAQADLDLALPTLRSAMKALDNLKKADISEVKAMAKPPEGVVKTMEAVCIMIGEKPDWETAKKVLGNVNFMKILKELDKDNIPEKVTTKLKKYTTDPSLSKERMASVSKAGASLMTWVVAMVDYARVVKEVGPKRARVEEMNKLLSAANAKLKEKQDQLQEVVSNVERLKKTCDEAVAERNRLNAKMEQTAGRLDRADKLTSGLGSEQARWQSEAERITGEIVYLVGDCFLSAACVSYAGPFTGDYRDSLIAGWHKFCLDRQIPTSENFSLQSTLGIPVEIRQWNINGLPSDSVSIDSAIMVKYGSRWPLMIDPQEQAKKWIKNEYKNKVVVLRMNNPDLLKLLEAAIRNGVPALIEDIGEELEGSLDPILCKQTFELGGRKLIRLGEQDVDYDDNFALFMTTKLPNPHYLPEVCIKANLLNFTVTLKGLEDQLLGEVVKKERADIEEKKNKLVVSMAEDRAQLSDLEAKILKMLSESQGNILDDQELIETLAESKSTSKIIEERVKESLETQKDIMAVREKYRKVAVRGSILYFVISDLALMDPMYQYSLSYFMKLFNLLIDNSEPALDLEIRLQNLMSFITYNVYANVCRGLFEKHKLIYSFLITTRILQEKGGHISQTEWNLLIRTASKLKDTSSLSENPAPEIISEIAWEFLYILQTQIPAFEGISQDVIDNLDIWRDYITATNPHTEELPGKWANLSPFQKVLVLKAFRPEKLMFAFSDFVASQVGKEYVGNKNAPLEEVHKDTDNKTPVIFVLSTGADPTGLLLRFAKEKQFLDKLNVISLGQGQGENARRLINQAKKAGEWVLLQNCHLAKSWMPELEGIVDGFVEDNSMHEDFRLWLTSMPAPYFPVAVLQKGVKLTNEPPKGLRANLTRSYNTVVNPEEFEKHSKPHPWKKLLFGLCFFHATIQERKKFGPLGWNIMYEFNDSDLETSIQVLRMFLDEQEEIPWDALRYVCGQINYGGRVTDDWDRRCLMSILHRFFTPSILGENYHFSPSGIYYAPREGDIGSYFAYLESLPLAADPEIFGMHENANITFQRKETNEIIGTVLSIQPREVGGAGGLTPDEVVANMAVEMLEKLPAPIKMAKLSLGEDEPEETELDKEGKPIKKEKKQVQLDSLVIVLRQEVERFNRLLIQIAKTLTEIQKAIKGEVVMSLELDRMYLAMINNQVPDLWTKVAYPSLKPLANWMIDLHQRIAFLNEWNDNGVPNSFWLSGFFFPQGFMTGVLQNHARKYRIPIDSLKFKFEVQNVYNRSEVLSKPEDGVYIDGLFMDGARWDPDHRVIADSHLGELFSTVPVIHFMPTDSTETSPKDYECPVYKTSVRAGVLSTTGQSTNFVLAVDLPSNREPDFWVLKGAAILCQLDQ